MIVDVINRSGVVELREAMIIRSDEERFYLLVNGYQRSVRIEDLDSGKYKMVAHRSECPGAGKCQDQGCPAHYAETSE